MMDVGDRIDSEQDSLYEYAKDWQDKVWEFVGDFHITRAQFDKAWEHMIDELLDYIDHNITLGD